MSFVYVDKVPQLGYLDGGVVQLLPAWFSSADDATWIERSIRSRRWGNIPAENFVIRNWNSYSVGTADASIPTDTIMYTPGTGQPVVTPTYGVLRNIIAT